MVSRDTGTPDHNLSTEHQKHGDATRPSDTLDREPARTPAGQPRPTSTPTDERAIPGGPGSQ